MLKPILLSLFLTAAAIAQVRIPGPGANPAGGGGGGGGTPALISRVLGPATFTQTGGTSSSISTLGATGLVVYVSGNSWNGEVLQDCVGASFASCGGTSTNTWTCTGWYEPLGNPGDMFCYSLSASVGGTHWFNVTGGSGSAPCFEVWAFSVITAYNSDLVPGSSGSNSSFSIGPDSPSSAPTVHITGLTNNQLFVSCAISGWSGVTFQEVGSNNFGLCVGYLIQGAGSAQSAAYTTGNAGQSAMIGSFH